MVFKIKILLHRKHTVSLAEDHVKLVNTIQFEAKIKSPFSNINAGSSLWFNWVHALGLHSQTF
jgi:hypothetical protein